MRRSLPRPAAAALAIALACAAAGCESTFIAPPPAAVFALFDPGASPPIIPLPNDLTGVPAPADAPAAAAFSGPLAPSSIHAGSVIVLDATTMMPLMPGGVSFDATDHLIVAPPAGGWPKGHRVAIALVGGMNGLQGAAGEPVVAGPAFFFARGKNPVSNCTAPGAGCTSATPALTLAQAIALEQLRQALAPLVGALEAAGVPRDQLALAWTFTVAG